MFIFSPYLFEAEIEVWLALSMVCNLGNVIVFFICNFVMQNRFSKWCIAMSLNLRRLNCTETCVTDLQGLLIATA